MKIFLQRYYLPILSGIFIGTSYIPLPPWASTFAFVPLFIFWLKETNLKRVLVAGWLTQFILTLIGFNWVAHTIHEFGHMPWAISIAGLFAFCSFANIDVVIAGFAQFYIIRWARIARLGPVSQIAVMALCTTLIKGSFDTIFHWNYGYPFHWLNWPMAQTAELIGFQGLSSIIILCNVATFHFWSHRKDHGCAKSLVTLVSVFVALNLAGYGLKKSWPAPDAEVNVLITQANIGNLEKAQAERGEGFQGFITEKYRSLTQIAKADSDNKKVLVDFVLWPETAFPYQVDQRLWLKAPNYPFTAAPLRHLARDLDTAIIAGGYGVSPRDGVIANTLFVIEKTGEIQPDPYYKTHLLAFGEYIPFGDVWPILYHWIPASQFSIGPGPTVKTLPLNGPQKEIKFGPEICYEGLFTDFSRALADQGAEIFLNVTNDSWYGKWQQPYQHLYNTLGRAIEYRRPFIRSTNTGITTVATALGDVMDYSPLHAEWTHVYTVPYHTQPQSTFYQKYPWLMTAVLIFTLAWIIFRARRLSQNN